MHWPWEFRTTAWAIVVVLIAWFVIAQPAKAGADVSHLMHWLGYAARQLSKFASSV